MPRKIFLTISIRRIFRFVLPFSDDNRGRITKSLAIISCKNLNLILQFHKITCTESDINNCVRPKADISWNKNTIKEFVLSQHDPLRYIKVKSDKLDHMVRTRQEDMVVQFS
jgi:hypothetical protein